MSVGHTVGRLLDRLGRLVGQTDDGQETNRERVHADRDEDFVVFVVGMRVNKLWKIHRWLPIFLVAPRMTRELQTDPDSGLLGSWTAVSPPRTIAFVQYWDSFEALEEYARDSDRLHLESWQDFANSDGRAVGLWHETYRVDADDYETVYVETPPRGLGATKETELVSASGHRRFAAGRLDDAATDAPSAEP